MNMYILYILIFENPKIIFPKRFLRQQYETTGLYRVFTELNLFIRKHFPIYLNIFILK